MEEDVDFKGLTAAEINERLGNPAEEPQPLLDSEPPKDDA